VPNNSIVVARRGVLGVPALSGALLGLVFWWQSLTPTFIPRPWEVQAGISACCLAIGYAIGTLIGRCLQRVVDRWSASSRAIVRRSAWVVLGVAWLISVVLGAAVWVAWQNEQRSLMRMESVGWLDVALAVTLSVVFGAVLILLGRVLSEALGAINRFFNRYTPALSRASPPRCSSWSLVGWPCVASSPMRSPLIGP
jgi:uncharacterized membrane protein